MSEDPALWSDPKKAQAIGKERKLLEKVVLRIDDIEKMYEDNLDMVKMGGDDEDEILELVSEGIEAIMKELGELEFEKMFNQEMDPGNCFMDITAGAGGTEAEDWAGMLFRMYIKYAESKGFKVEILEEDEGDIAGINRASLKISGDYAYGLLRTETGVHRLVRHSPFNAANKRQTSFASVFVSPEVDDSIDIEINPADLRIDTYRASGAGGQHINKTDSAVRITHVPTGIVVQCQNDRSQIRNRASAMEVLKSRLYELEMNKRNEVKQELEDSKDDVGWGRQIRSYVFDQSRVKDLRTGYESGNVKGVMDGDLDGFITESLKQGV